MALKLSTALRNKLLDTGPLRTIFNLGQINIYNGVAPASADDAVVGTLILIVKNGASGLTFEAAAVNGAISKKLTETWNGSATATLQAQYFRLVAPGDTGVASTTESRLQGSVAQAGADLNMTTINLQSGTVYPIDNFAVSLPAS
jgi:hypothetical protein